MFAGAPLQVFVGPEWEFAEIFATCCILACVMITDSVSFVFSFRRKGPLPDSGWARFLDLQQGRCEMMRAIELVVACVAVLVATVGQVQAGVIITLTDNGSDITAAAEGQIDTSAITNVIAGLNFGSTGGLADFGAAVDSTQGLGMVGGIALMYNGVTFSGPSYPFIEDSVDFHTDSGNQVGIGFSGSADTEGIILADGYVSGTPISSTGTWLNTEFSDLGVTDGDSFTWTWDGGGTGKFLTVNVGNVAAVPEPSSLALFGIGACVAGAARRRRRDKQQEAREVAA